MLSTISAVKTRLLRNPVVNSGANVFFPENYLQRSASRGCAECFTMSGNIPDLLGNCFPVDSHFASYADLPPSWGISRAPQYGRRSPHI